MSKILLSQNQFNAGVFSPRLYGRTDIEKYKNAVKTADNCFTTVHGPMIRRSGTKFIAHAKNSADTIRLGKFQFAKDDAYILEMGDTYMRFFSTSGQVVESATTITGITKANPGVVSITSHGYSDGDHVYIEAVVGMTEVNNSNIPYIVANKNANDFELTDIDGNNVNTTSYTTYSSAGTSKKIYEITTPWSNAEVQDLTWAQFGDDIYFAHPSFEPRKLTRASETSWAIATLDASPAPLYEPGAEPAVTCTPAATSGVGVNFTAGSATWLDADVGRQITNNSTGETGRAIITSVTSTTVAVCDIVETFTDTNAIASGDWLLDLSPICDLEWEGTAAGSIVNVRSRYLTGSKGAGKTITGITKANPAVVSSTAHGFINGDSVVITDVVGMTEVNGSTFRVAGKNANDFQLQSENSSAYITYASGGTARRVQEDDLVDAFRAADVGDYIVVAGGVMKIVTRNGSNDIDCEILKSFTSDTRTGNWSIEKETWDATRGYPRAVGLYQERLVFGGTSKQPQTLWMSEVGIFNGFGTGSNAADGIDVTLGSAEVNQINWIGATRDLIVGTAGGEITINGGTSGSAITPSSVSQQSRTYHGSNRQQPVVVGNEVLFLQQSGRKVRTFRFDFDIDNYTGEDLTFLSENLTEGGVSELAYSQEPDSRIFAVTTNGDLLVGSYERAQNVIGWTKYDTDGDYENVQTISQGEEDQTWVLVERLVNSTTRRFIEYFDNGDGRDDLDGYVDSYLTLSTNIAITGLTAANPGVVTATSHGLSNGDKVVIKDLVDPIASSLTSTNTNMSALNQCSFVVANKNANDFELTNNDGTNIDLSGYNAYGSGGNVWLKVTAISGLDHLEGKTVQIKGDGAKQPDKTVSSGAVTASTAAGEFTIGLPYTTTITTLRKEFDIGMGTMQGQRMRPARPVARVYRSTLPTLNDEFLPARSSANQMDKRVPLYDGDLEYGPLTWNNHGELTFTVTTPYPLHLTGIYGAWDGGVK